MISRDMRIAEVVRRYPETISILKNFGLDCNECQVADYADMEHGAAVHSIDIEVLLAELNRAISGRTTQ